MDGTIDSAFVRDPFESEVIVAAQPGLVLNDAAQLPAQHAGQLVHGYSCDADHGLSRSTIGMNRTLRGRVLLHQEPVLRDLQTIDRQLPRLLVCFEAEPIRQQVLHQGGLLALGNRMSGLRADIVPVAQAIWAADDLIVLDDVREPISDFSVALVTRSRPPSGGKSMTLSVPPLRFGWMDCARNTGETEPARCTPIMPPTRL